MTYFRIDYNGFTGKRGIYGSDVPMDKILLQYVYLSAIRPDPQEKKSFPDPGIAIYSENHELIDKIYWRENKERILHYFPDFVFFDAKL